jgi:phenylacetate-CoA ligase
MQPLISKYFFYYPATLIKGEIIGKYLHRYERFQYYSHDEIVQYQLTHLKKLLLHAYSKSVHYKKLFDENGISVSDIQTLSDLKKIPYLTKIDLSTKLTDITAINSGLLVSKKTTGGSTGQAVTLLKNADALARERAATWRSYKWAGVAIGDPQARFWGVPLHVSQRLKYRIINFIANRKIFSAFNIDEQCLDVFYRQLLRFKPAYLYGYVSVIEIFASYIKKHQYVLPDSIKCVITTSEVLSAAVRKEIEGSLKLDVFNEYGCGEVGSVAHECEHGEMHVMDDNLILEIIPAIDSSSVGEIVVTDLFNYATPLIRYRLGDYASISEKNCACGRTLKVIGNIHGRAYDCIHTEDDKVFHPEVMMYIFEDIKTAVGGIKQFQVVQETLGSLCINIIKAEGYSSETEIYIKKIIAAKLHELMAVRFEYVDEIQREKSGKLRLVKSALQG